MAAPRRKGRPPKIDVETILAAATDVLDELGFAGLTMREVAERCGVTAMSLYRHVQTKDDLLMLLAGQALDELVLPEPGTLPWQDEIREIMRSLHHVLRSRPDFAQIVGATSLDTRAAFGGMEQVLGTLKAQGLSDQQAVASYDTLVSFVRGFNQQHSAHRAYARPAAERLARIDALQPEDFPHVVRLGGEVLSRDPARHFDQELDIVLAGISAFLDTA